LPSVRSLRLNSRTEFTAQITSNAGNGGTALLICPITAETAEIAGRIGAECAARGVVVPFGDSLIGACAIERTRAILTRNTRHFGMLPGLELLSA
jgi:predicted nucleic acid-binding protein